MGDVIEYWGIPLDFLVSVLARLPSVDSEIFSLEFATDVCLDRGMVDVAFPAVFRELLDDEFEISPACNSLR